MKLTSQPLAAIVFVIFFGGIALTSALGWFNTSTTKVPVTYTEGEFAGQYNPADIRGSYLFDDISSLFGVPLEDLQSAFLLPSDDTRQLTRSRILKPNSQTAGTKLAPKQCACLLPCTKGFPIT